MLKVRSSYPCTHLWSVSEKCVSCLRLFTLSWGVGRAVVNKLHLHIAFSLQVRQGGLKGQKNFVKTVDPFDL